MQGMKFDLERDSVLHVELAKSNSKGKRSRGGIFFYSSSPFLLHICLACITSSNFCYCSSFIIISIFALLVVTLIEAAAVFMTSDTWIFYVIFYLNFNNAQLIPYAASLIYILNEPNHCLKVWSDVIKNVE